MTETILDSATITFMDYAYGMLLRFLTSSGLIPRPIETVLVRSHPIKYHIT